MHFGPHFISHRRARETWSRRLMVTVFVTAGTMLRWSDADNRATITLDPYDDAL